MWFSAKSLRLGQPGSLRISCISAEAGSGDAASWNKMPGRYSTISLFVYKVTAYLLPTRNHLIHRLIEVAKSIQVAKFCFLSCSCRVRFPPVYCKMFYGTPNRIGCCTTTTAIWIRSERRRQLPTFGCLADGFSDESRGSKRQANCLRTGCAAMACAAEAAW